MKRAIAILGACCALLGAAAGACAMYVAWEDNPHEMYYTLDQGGTRVVDWGYWALVGLSWFLIVFVPLSLVGAGILALSYRIDKKRSAG